MQEDRHWQNRKTVEDAYGRIRERVRETPVMTSRLLNELAGTSLFFKCEHLQASGAFKFRGATHALTRLSEDEKERGVVTHSSGNHAQALALAALEAGIQATIVMPEGSNPLKVEGTRSYGARVVMCPNTQQDRERTARHFQLSEGLTLVHPYDDWRIIAGAGTAALELMKQVPDLGAIVTPLGGGGLLAGTCLAADRSCRVFGAEPLGADDGYRGFHAGERVTTQTPDTLCDGLRTCVGEQNFEVLQYHLAGIGRATDSEVRSAQWLLMTRMKQVVEPSSAVALACILNGSIPKEDRMGIILSGGNVDLSDWFCPAETLE